MNEHGIGRQFVLLSYNEVSLDGVCVMHDAVTFPTAALVFEQQGFDDRARNKALNELVRRI